MGLERRLKLAELALDMVKATQKGGKSEAQDLPSSARIVVEAVLDRDVADAESLADLEHELNALISDLKNQILQAPVKKKGIRPS